MTGVLSSEGLPPRKRPRGPFSLGAPRPLVAPIEGLLEVACELAGADTATAFVLERGAVSAIATVGASSPPPGRLAMRALALGSQLVEPSDDRFMLAIPMAACEVPGDERRRYRPRATLASACLLLQGPGDAPSERLTDDVRERLVAALLGALEARSFADSVATDQATGALNRAAFERAALLELGIAANSGRPVALLLIEVLPRRAGADVGHADEAMKLAAHAARVALRADDLIGRRGPDELAALLVDASPDHLQATSERVLRRVAEAVEPLGLGAPSIGAAAYPLHATTLEELDVAALDAQESARSTGPGTAHIYDSTIGPSATAARKSYFTGDPWLDARKSSLLFESVLAANAARELPEALDAVLRALLTATSADRAALLIGDGHELEVAAARDHHFRRLKPPLRISRSACLRSLALGRATFVVDTQNPGSNVGQSALDLSLRSVVTVPLLGREGPVGVLYADSVRPSFSDYTPEDLAYLEALAAQAALALENATLRQRLQTENADLKRVVRAGGVQESMRGSSPSIRAALRHLPEIIDSSSSVVILGESGTGKELLARSIHRLGPRSEGSFVAQNCAAIPHDLLESELFGHAEGAFSGATKSKRGLLELADGGTFFLDEVGDLSPSLQSKLLRVLEDKEVRRIGDTHGRQLDFRILCATNRDLERDVDSGRFRRDLFYRLNVFTVRLPPLRDRREDIPELAEHFALRAAQQLGRRPPVISDAAMEALCEARWPGNVRELANVLEKAVTLARGGAVETSHLELRPAEPAATTAGSLRALLSRVERDAVASALAASDGNVSAAARALGIARQQLQRLVKKYELTR